MSQPTPAIFIADSPGLDFLNSIATPVDEPVDWIDDGEGLIGWLQQAELVPVEVLTDIGGAATPGELDAVATQARALRDWFRGFVADRKGAPLSQAYITTIEPLNRLLARDQTFLQIVPGAPLKETEGRLELQAQRRWLSAESLLQPIAQVLASLVCEEDFTYVKACEGHACTLLFADRTKGHRRRWCSMSVCGNRAKQLAHYRRRHALD